MAVYSREVSTSGTVPLLGRDTAPSERKQTHLPAPTVPWFRRMVGRAVEDHVSPDKNGNGLSDVSKTGLPLPVLFTLGSVLVAGLAAFYGLNAKQATFETALGYERQLDELRTQLTKEQIDNSTLRTASMMLSAENTKLNAQCVPRGR